MGLICRRFLSSSINGIIISAILTVISLFIVMILWFIGLRYSLDIKWFALFFAVTYSFLGSVGSWWPPKLGSKIARIQLQELKPKPHKAVKVFFRLLLFYSVPLLLVFASTGAFRKIAADDPKMMLLLFAPVMFCGFFTGLLIPISITIGKGKQGIHDAFSGLAVSKIKNEIGELMPFKKLVVRSLIITALVSVVFALGILELISVTKIQNTFFKAANTSAEFGAYEQIIKDFDSIIPLTPLPLRSYDASKGFKWWVDLTGDQSEQTRVSKGIGLPDMSVGELLGYGFSVTRLSSPVTLLHMDRENTKVIPIGEEILSVFLFVDSGVFYYPEVKKIIEKYFSSRVKAFAKLHGINTLRVRTVRIAKTGPIVAGYFDEVYVTDEDIGWRDQVNAYLPVILNWANVIHTGSFIRSSDLE